MMINRRDVTRMGLVLAFVLVPLAPNQAPAADPRFDRIVDDYFAARFAYRPSEATAAGLHQHDRQLEDASGARVARRIEELARFQKRLWSFTHDKAAQQSPLASDDAIDLAFLQGQIEAELIDLRVIREWDYLAARLNAKNP